MKQIFFKQIENIFSVESNAIESVTYPYKTALSEANVKTNRMASTKWTYHKECTVCSCHVTYMFESESTLYSCLNVKELHAWSRRETWRWSDCNWTRTENHLVLKQTLNHLAKLASLAKWLSVRLRTKWFSVRVQLQSQRMQFCQYLLYFLKVLFQYKNLL